MFLAVRLGRKLATTGVLLLPLNKCVCRFLVGYLMHAERDNLTCWSYYSEAASWLVVNLWHHEVLYLR
jgi:hypothetical protein